MHSRPSPSIFRHPSLTHTTYSHATTSHTHTSLTCSQTTPSQNLLTHNSLTYNSLTHNSHTHTHNVLTHTHTTPSNTTLSQTAPSHTLTQNCHCEVCCGMHLTCKDTSIPPDRNGSVKGPDKVEEATIAIASVTAKLNKTRLRHPCMRKLSKKCLAGSGLSRSPYTRTDCKWLILVIGNKP